jgi:hypothetical protein
MFKNNVRKLAFALLLVLLTGPGGRAFASGTSSTSTSSPTSTAAPSPTADGPTGTDPEPIEPDIVSLILTLINLA